MSEDKKQGNMELWNQVCETDPAITKRVDTRGGWTAIDAQAQIKRATELWGPYGTEWGVRVCKYMFFPDESKAEITLNAEFYYPSGEFEIATDMIYKPGNDSRKKLLTDLTTKALSKLGFNSDVFEGKFDDNKYVQSLKTKPIPDITETQLKEIKKLIKDTDTDKTKFMLYLKNTFKTAKIEELNAADATVVTMQLNAKLDNQNADN